MVVIDEDENVKPQNENFGQYYNEVETGKDPEKSNKIERSPVGNENFNKDILCPLITVNKVIHL